MSVKFDEIQSEVLEQIYEPRREFSQVLNIRGFAGTGKSTISGDVFLQRPSWSFIAPTNKAVQVLKQKGVLSAQTMFSFIYQCKGEDNNYDEDHHKFLSSRLSDVRFVDEKLKIQNSIRKLTGDNRKLRYDEKHEDGDLKHKTVVLDESSMVTDENFEALIRTGARIITFGDSGQLPPVKGKPFLAEGREDYLLTRVYRQKGESLVLDIATELRQKESTSFIFHKSCPVRDIPYCVDMKLNDLLEIMPHFDQTIAYRNSTVCTLNHKYRTQILGYSENYLAKGEKLMVLSNNKGLKVYNGQSLDVLEETPIERYMQVKTIDPITETLQENIFSNQNLSLNEPLDPYNRTEYEVFADYSYTMTCHKAQGSAWPKVLVVLQGGESWRWVYTAVTRASEDVLIVRLR